MKYWTDNGVGGGRFVEIKFPAMGHDHEAVRVSSQSTADHSTIYKPPVHVTRTASTGTPKGHTEEYKFVGEGM